MMSLFHASSSIPNLLQIQTSVKKSIKRKSLKKKSTLLKRAFEIESPNEDNKQYYLGYFCLGSCNGNIPETSKSYEIIFKQNDDTDNLIVNFDDGSTAIINLLIDAPFITNIFGSKLFCINLRKEVDNDDVMVDIYFLKIPIYNKQKRALQNVLEYLFKIKVYKNEKNYSPESLNSIYSKIKQLQQDEIPLYEILTKYLRPQLREYQQKSVNWMLHRELSDLMQDEILYPPYLAVKLPTGIEIYCDPYSGSVLLEKPTTKLTCRGGILADEMGLGKTVEILALILSNRKPCKDEEVDISKVIIKKGVKRSIEPVCLSEETSLVVEAKKSKVPPEFVKKGKSETKVRLEEWYNQKLASTNVRPARENIIVSCICGLFQEENLVECSDCGKKQHFKCMGFKNEKNKDYLCPQCWKLKPLTESKATLVICPNTLKHQWKKEICSHVKQGLKVLLYEGTNALPIYPTEFLEYNIVLTTYSTIQNELRQAEQNYGKTLRHKSKYASPGSPISLIKWWRLCFDEGQLVEGKVLQMAEKLESNYRWAITGTPMSKGLLDLHTIIEFLNIQPYDNQQTWMNSMYFPYIHGIEEPIFNLISKILWRTEKAEVIDQIGIPAQTFEKHIIELESIERYMYDKEHETCRMEFVQKLEKHDPATPLKSLPNTILQSLLAPLLSLRQVCCLRNSIKGRYLATKKVINSMQELLDALIAKNINECEEELRYIVSSLNGQSGLHLLNNNLKEAVECYRKVLQLAAEFSEENNKSSGTKLNIDKLLLIHAMHNLAETLDSYQPTERTLRDEQLRSDCIALERKYISRFEKQTISAIKIFALITEEINDLLKESTMSEGQWYSGILEYISSNNLMDDLIQKVKSSFEQNVYQRMYSDELSLNRRLKEWEESVYNIRENAIDSVYSLFNLLENGDINICPILAREVAECHLRPIKKKDKRLCRVCESNNILKTLESTLFAIIERDKTDLAKGSWKPSVEEFWLKGCYSFAKQRDLKELVAEGKIHLKVLDRFKKEFKELRKVWTHLEAQICALDELDMCKSRIELYVETEQKETDTPRNLRMLQNTDTITKYNKVPPHMIFYQLSSLNSEEKEREKILENKLRQEKYLQSLNNKDRVGQKPDPCPICKSQLENKWNVLTCGHCYCYDCLETLISRSVKNRFTCSVCRQPQDAKDINFIVIKAEDAEVASEETMQVKLIGESSSKVEGITKLILNILTIDSAVKIIIFSTWKEVLSNLSRMFSLNRITSEIYYGHTYQKRLDKFKDPTQDVSVLLLPLNLGSKGLNLIEATHVIFAEPVLDPATEHQAIGRVHRIGQTKPTKVHKFIIKDSIEENIDLAASTQPGEWDSNKVTLQQIKALFEKNIPSY